MTLAYSPGHLPPKKRTFMLGDKELPCPDGGSSAAVQITYTIDELNCHNRTFYFSSAEEASTVGRAIEKVLSHARDKE